MSLFSCSNENLSELDNVNQVSELAISTSILSHTAKSKSLFTTNNGDGFYTGPVMAEGLAENSNIGISVFNAGTSELYTTANNGNAENLKWNNAGGWKYVDATGSSLKFFLGSAKADLVAYFPYTSENYNLEALPVQAGYTDFMYGVAKENGEINSTNKNASILLNHGLAMISFTFTKGAGYTGECNLQSITVNNTILAGTMNIQGGAISAGSEKTNIHIASFAAGAYTPSNTNEATTAANWSEW
ncbi:MAG: fimbrillin family protein, partial [Bacteroidales bacterium]